MGEPAIAKPPFSADQIRDATTKGRSYEFEIEAPGRPTIRRRMVFIAADAAGCTIESTLLNPDGEVEGIASVSHSTWEELVAHASYPIDKTEISEAPAKTPAGEFDCILYTVREGPPAEQTVTRAYFAKDMPGAPVKLVVEKNGGLVSQMRLVSASQVAPKKSRPR